MEKEKKIMQMETFIEGALLMGFLKVMESTFGVINLLIREILSRAAGTDMEFGKIQKSQGKITRVII
jgi:hypothetical protein